MTLDESWNQPILVQMTLGEMLVLHAALTHSLARLWVPDAIESADMACTALLQQAGEAYSVEVCERLLNTIITHAPDLLEESPDETPAS